MPQFVRRPLRKRGDVPLSTPGAALLLATGISLWASLQLLPPSHRHVGNVFSRPASLHIDRTSHDSLRRRLTIDRAMSSKQRQRSPVSVGKVTNHGSVSLSSSSGTDNNEHSVESVIANVENYTRISHAVTTLLRALQTRSITIVPAGLQTGWMGKVIHAIRSDGTRIHVIAVDASMSGLGKARERLSGIGDETEFVRRDISREGLLHRTDVILFWARIKDLSSESFTLAFDMVWKAGRTGGCRYFVTPQIVERGHGKVRIVRGVWRGDDGSAPFLRNDEIGGVVDVGQVGHGRLYVTMYAIGG